MIKFSVLVSTLLLIGTLGAAEFGQQAPELEVARFIGGKRFRIADMIGKKMVVLHFWTRDCAPCDKAVPLIADAARQFGTSAVFLAIGDSDEKSVEEYPHLASMKIPAAVDSMARTADTYLRETDSFPTDVVIGRDGRIAWIGPTAELHRVLTEISSGQYNIRTAMELDQFNRKMVTLLKNQDFEEALTTVQERRKKFPDDPGLAIGAANLLAGKLNRTDDGLKILDDSIKRNPQEFPLYNAKLRILHFRGKPDPRVIPVYQSIIRNFAGQPMLLVQLAHNMQKAPPGTYPLLTRYELASAAWKSGKFSNDLDRGRAATVLARCYYECGMVDEAVQLQNKALMWLHNTPEEKRASHNLAIYRDARKTASAIQQQEVEK